MAEDSVLEQRNPEHESLHSKSSAEQSMAEHGAMDAVKHFAQNFANVKRIVALKISNWVLLLAVAILTTVCGSPRLRLDNWSEKVQRWSSPIPKIGPEDHWNAIPFGIWAMFVLATFSLGMYCYGKKTMENSKRFLSCLAITDVCFSLLFLVNLLIVLAHFLSQATSEYLWFYPCLVNGAPLENLAGFESLGLTSTSKPPSYTLNYRHRDYYPTANYPTQYLIECDYDNLNDCQNQLTHLRQNVDKTTTTTPRPTRYYQPDYYLYRHVIECDDLNDCEDKIKYLRRLVVALSTTRRPIKTSYYNLPENKQWKMVKRKQQILARLVLDPTVAILAALAILVNIDYIFCIRKAMKQSTLRPSNYEKLHPYCPGMDSTYAKFFPFGLLKIVHWVIPAFLFHANLYRITDPDDHGKIIMICWFGISFCYWMFYVKSIRFPSEDYSVALGSSRLLFIMDFVVYGIGIILYLSINPERGGLVQKVSLGAIFFLLCSISINVHLMFKYGGFSKLCKKFDLISINVTVNVTKDDNQDSESAVMKTNKNSASDGQENKDDHNENQSEKGLHYIDV